MKTYKVTTYAVLFVLLAAMGILLLVGAVESNPAYAVLAVLLGIGLREWRSL